MISSIIVTGFVLLTAIRVTSELSRPALLQAASTRFCISYRFSFNIIESSC
ncbi:MAG: hypothetical protein RHS_0429 [Robinsoniella sp. RHS]|nr:MAG: hypothetical protein RHS_0429 [Robinsoniella sp. RHS]